MENLNLKPANIAKAIRMNNWGPVKKQATRPVAAWLDKQNKQLLIAIISLRSTPLRQAEEDGPPHGGEYIPFNTQTIRLLVF